MSPLTYPPLSPAANAPPLGPPFQSAAEIAAGSRDRPTPPHMFEDLRIFALEAVEQLVREMARQQVNYLVPAENILALVESVAQVQGTSPWDIWEAWALRHALPVHTLVERSRTQALTAADRMILGQRLRDLFGYALLGLVLVERE